MNRRFGVRGAFPRPAATSALLALTASACNHSPNLALQQQWRWNSMSMPAAPAPPTATPGAGSSGEMPPAAAPTSVVAPGNAVKKKHWRLDRPKVVTTKKIVKVVEVPDPVNEEYAFRLIKRLRRVKGPKDNARIEAVEKLIDEIEANKEKGADLKKIINERMGGVVMRTAAGRAETLYPLHVAARCGSAKLVEILVDAGADVNLRTGRQCSAALHFAAAFGSLDCVTILLKAGAKPDAFDTDRIKPASRAARQGHQHVCDALRKRYTRVKPGLLDPAYDLAKGVNWAVQPNLPIKTIPDPADSAAEAAAAAAGGAAGATGGAPGGAPGGGAPAAGAAPRM